MCFKYDVKTIKKKVTPLNFYGLNPSENFKKSKSKWLHAGCCPFHEDKEPGHFLVHIQNGAYKCICIDCDKKGGDIIAFTMDFNKLAFVDALAKVAEGWRLR